MACRTPCSLPTNSSAVRVPLDARPTPARRYPPTTVPSAAALSSHARAASRGLAAFELDGDLVDRHHVGRQIAGQCLGGWIPGQRKRQALGIDRVAGERDLTQREVIDAKRGRRKPGLRLAVLLDELQRQHAQIRRHGPDAPTTSRRGPRSGRRSGPAREPRMRRGTRERAERDFMARDAAVRREDCQRNSAIGDGLARRSVKLHAPIRRRAMKNSELLRLRLHNQQITHARARHPQEVVSSLVAMQAQEYAMSKWAIALRMASAVQDADLERAFNAGKSCARMCCGPPGISSRRRISAGCWRCRRRGFTPRMPTCIASLSSTPRCSGAATPPGSCAGGARLPETHRPAVCAGEVRRKAEGLRLAAIMMHAELEQLICSGPREGQQFTYALLEPRTRGAGDAA